MSDERREESDVEEAISLIVTLAGLSADNEKRSQAAIARMEAVSQELRGHSESTHRAAAQAVREQVQPVIEDLRKAANLAVANQKMAGKYFRELMWWAFGGMVAGLVFAFLLLRAMPIGIQAPVVGFGMASNPLEAGMSLVKWSNPEIADVLEAARQLEGRNVAPLAECRNKAALSGQPQACTVTVDPVKSN